MQCDEEKEKEKPVEPILEEPEWIPGECSYCGNGWFYADRWECPNCGAV